MLLQGAAPSVQSVLYPPTPAACDVQDSRNVLRKAWYSLLWHFQPSGLLLYDQYAPSTRHPVLTSCMLLPARPEKGAFRVKVNGREVISVGPEVRTTSGVPSPFFFFFFCLFSFFFLRARVLFFLCVDRLSLARVQGLVYAASAHVLRPSTHVLYTSLRGQCSRLMHDAGAAVRCAARALTSTHVLHPSTHVFRGQYSRLVHDGSALYRRGHSLRCARCPWRRPATRSWLRSGRRSREASRGGGGC